MPNSGDRLSKSRIGRILLKRKNSFLHYGMRQLPHPSESFKEVERYLRVLTEAGDGVITKLTIVTLEKESFRVLIQSSKEKNLIPIDVDQKNIQDILDILKMGVEQAVQSITIPYPVSEYKSYDDDLAKLKYFVASFILKKGPLLMCLLTWEGLIPLTHQAEYKKGQSHWERITYVNKFFLEEMNANLH